MPSAFSFIDLQHILLVKICFFLFVALGIIGIYRAWRPIVFLLLAGGLSAAAYLLLVNNLFLSFWGLTGDEITIAAMYEVFAHGSLLSDFAYAHLPPFYPPLFFWIFGFVGRLFDWNGVQIATFASATTMAFFPAAFYLLQRRFWTQRAGAEAPGHVAWFLASVLVLLFAGWDAVITKPYELVSAALVIAWTVFLLIRIKEGNMSARTYALFGIAGGLLFLLFYFWFFLAAIGIAVFFLFEKEKTPLKTYGALFVIGGLVLLVGAPFWLPLAQSYAAYGSENWQFGFFVIDWIATHGPIFSLSIFGSFSFFGLVSLAVWRRWRHMRILLALFAASYIWQIMGMTTLFFFATPLQESKGFLFFQTALLALAAGFGIERLLAAVQRRWQRFDVRAVRVLGLLALAPLLFFGTFVDDPDVRAVRLRAAAPRPGILALAAFLNGEEDIHARTVLDSGIPELYAFVPLNHAIYFNQHNSHPAAGFSDRLRILRDAAASDREAFYDTIQLGRAPVDMFVFYKGEAEPGAYTIYVHRDRFPHKIAEEMIHVPRDYFVEPYVKKRYENNYYVVYEMNPL